VAAGTQTPWLACASAGAACGAALALSLALTRLALLCAAMPTRVKGVASSQPRPAALQLAMREEEVRFALPRLSHIL
jgi:hypothetical protein